MLMIDRVVLIAINESHQMREFECENATRIECYLYAPHEVFDVRHMSEDIVANQQVSPPSVGMQHPRCLRAKKSHNGFNAFFLLCMKSDVRCRLNTQDRNTFIRKMLEQISIIARNLYHESIFIEPEAIDHHRSVASRVLNPSTRNTAEVSIIAEYRLRSFEFLKLRKKAFLTHPYLERICPLTL